MNSLFEKDHAELIARGDPPLVPTRPASPSMASLFIDKYAPWCSSFQPRNEFGGVVECPSTLHMLCTQCNASGADIRVVVDHDTGAVYFICNAETCFGLMFARWSPRDLTVKTWSGVQVESAPTPRIRGSLNRMVQLKVLDLNDSYFLQHIHHNSDWISFAHLPDSFVNNRLAFGGPKAIELRRRVRKTESRWFAFTPGAGEFYIGKEKKLVFRIVNSTVPTPFRLTAADDFDALVAEAKEVPTDAESDSPVPSKPSRHIPAAAKKPNVSAAAKKPPTAPVAGRTRGPSTAPASVKNREVIDLTLSDDDVPIVVASVGDAAPVSAGQKRKRDDKVVGKEKKIRLDRDRAKTVLKENIAATV